MCGCRTTISVLSRRVSKACLIGTMLALAALAVGTTVSVSPAAALDLPTLTPGTPRLAVGSAHKLALRFDGTLWAWGWNNDGQLGDGPGAGKAVPTRVGDATEWVGVFTGQNHSLGIRADGSLWAWGNNYSGQLGDGTMDDKYVPTRIGDGTDWVAASGGRLHTLALKSDGSLWAWGNNSRGQLGDGTNDRRTVPTRIGSGTDWVAVCAGDLHSLALRSDGSLWAWGDNWRGQLGDGTLEDRNAPTRIGSSTDWVTVSAGHMHSLALKSDGTLYAWGSNFDGELGDGTTSARVAPTRTGTDDDWVSIAAGMDYSLACKDDGSLWAWGANSDGQLGDGTTIGKLVPTRSGSATGWETVDAYARGSAALKSGGSLWGWGANGAGEVGDGTTADRTSPVRIMPLGVDITVTSPTGFNVWAKSQAVTVSWSTNGIPLSGEFGVWVIDGPLSSYVGKLVPAAGKSSDYSTKVILNVPVGGPYRFTVNYRPTAGTGAFASAADSPGTFTVVNSDGITVTAPTATSHWLACSSQTVSWTLTSALSGGEFRVWLVSAGGTWAIGRQVPPVAGRLSYSTTFAANVLGGNGYRAAVYWRPTVGSGSYLVTAKSPPFPVTGVDITSPTASSRWAVNSTQTVSWTIAPAVTGGQFLVALVSTRGTWYINRYVPAVVDQSAYSTTFRLTGVPAGTGYTARVYWRPVAGSGAWVLCPRSAAFTVTP